MPVIAFLASLVSAGALIVSGGMKVGRLRPVRQAMRELDVPRGVQRQWVAALLPVLEICCGTGALAFDGAPRVACSLIVLGLHGAFLLVVARVVREGRPAECHCFGALSDAHVSGRTLARNAAFTVAAAAALTFALTDQRADLTGIGTAGAAVALLIATVALRGWHEVRQWRVRPRAEDLALTDRHGARLPLTELQAPPTVLVFFSPGCQGCHDVVPYFRWWPSLLPDDLDLQPVLRGTPEDFAAHEVFAELVDHAWYDNGDVAAAVGVPASPGAVCLSRRRPLGSGAVFGRHAIEDLLRQHGARIDHTAARPGSAE